MKAIVASCLGLLSALSATAGVYVDPRVPNLFEGSVMTNESVAFMGTGDAAPLMYAAEEILSVKSPDLKTEYENGRDWTFDAGTGRIMPTYNTRMPYSTEAQYYPKSGTNGVDVFACNVPGKSYVLFGEGTTMYRRQVLVTYRHTDTWRGTRPRNDGAAFAPMLGALRTGSDKILFYGDSITTGANSSDNIEVEPRILDWPRQVYAAITNHTGNANLIYVNNAVGGTTTIWGYEKVQERVIAHEPKLAVIAFGMNDDMRAEYGEELVVANYTNGIARIVQAIRDGSSETSVLLVSPMLPNPEATDFKYKHDVMPACEAALADLVTDFRAKGFAQIGLANVTTVHGAVLEKKRFRDMTGNNINHCNDFCARIYRDTILGALGLVQTERPILRPQARTTWFNGGIATGWPTAASKTGGDWQNVTAGVFQDDAVALTNANDGLSFTATTAAVLVNDTASLTIRTLMEVTDELPESPNAITGIVALDEYSAINYFVLVSGANGQKTWQRLRGASYREGESSEITITLQRVGARLTGVFRIGDYVSPTLDLGEASSVRLDNVSFAGCGKVGALSAEKGHCYCGSALVVE